jgi:hypothetical protein
MQLSAFIMRLACSENGASLNAAVEPTLNRILTNDDAPTDAHDLEMASSDLQAHETRRNTKVRRESLH